MVPTGFRKLLTLTLLMFLVASFGAYSIDVNIDVPQVEIVDGSDLDTLARLAGIEIEEEIQTQLNTLGDELKGNIETDELERFTELTLLSEGFANAGATAAHAATPRSFIDYRTFAIVFGPGFGFSAPGLDWETLTSAAEDIEEEGDIYAGAAIHMFNGSLGFNISRWVPRTRAYLKIGYTNFPSGTITDEVSFNALNLGIGGSYQLLQSRQLPLGFLRWRGLSLGSGFIFQRNTTDIEVALAEEGFQSGAITLADLGLNDLTLFQGAGSSLSPETEVGSIFVTAPVLEASIESRTFSIPLEVNTGLRVLWLLDLNVGAGVDLVFGSSDLSMGASTEADFDVGSQLQGQINFEAGSAEFSLASDNGPQFLRPRLTAGAGLNFGPVKLDVPVMLYFDGEGNSVMAGVNVGIVW